MSRRAVFWLAAVAAALASANAAAIGGSCLPRDLTAAEKQSAERLAERFVKMLPPPPAGWKLRDADRVDIGSGSCMDSEAKKNLPMPVGVTMRRTYIRDEPAPAAPAAPEPAAPAAPARSAQDAARAQTLERSIAELQRQEQELTAQYQAARRDGDLEAQRRATQALRETRQAMNEPRRELAAMRGAERVQREARNQASTEAAVARAQAQVRNRRDALVAFYTNSGGKQTRAAQTVSIPGVPLAVHETRGATHLLFGNWEYRGHYAWAPFDKGAPTTRVQDVSVRVDGNDEITRELIGKIDLRAVQSVIDR